MSKYIVRFPVNRSTDFYDGIISNIHVKVGANVKMHSKLVDIETSKMILTINSEMNGKVSHILVGKNERVSEGDPLLIISKD